MSESSATADPLFLPEVAERTPLRWHEVPLPANGGYSLDILDPEVKKEQQRKHEEKCSALMRERLVVHDKAKNDKEFRKLLYEKCRRDVTYFINMFLWTYDDREEEVEMFVGYEFQERQMAEPFERLCKIKAPKRSTLGYGKSRGQGFTWYIEACILRNFLFWKNWSTLIGTENRDDVDDAGQEATTQSMFGKIRFMIDSMPKWMRDDLLGPLFKKDSFNKRWSMKNPKRPRNVIHGKQLGGMFGRSRRYSLVFADEVAHSEEMKNAVASLKQTTNRFIFGSTPKGRGNFFDQAMNGTFPGVIKFWMWWAQSPKCDIAWYNEQRSDMDDPTIAQELDMNFDMSVGGRVLDGITLDWFTFIKDKDGNEIPFMYDERIPLEVVIDPGFADAMAVIWCQFDELTGQGRVVDFVQTERRSVDWIVPFITGRTPEVTHQNAQWPHDYNDVEQAIIERHTAWDAPSFVYGDSAGGAATWTTGHSAWDELSKYEIWVDEIKILNDKEALRRMENFLRYVRFSRHLKGQRNGPRSVTPTFAEVITQWRYPKKREGATTQPSKPVHDKHCHGGDCLKMWAQVHDIPDSKAMPVESGKIRRRRGSDIVDLYEGNSFR